MAGGRHDIVQRGLYRFDEAVRQTLPFVITMTLLLATTLPSPVPFLDDVGPAWVLIAIFHWTVRCPDQMPLTAVFALGILQDLLLGYPVGPTALVYVLIRANAPMLVEWAGGRGTARLWWMFCVTAVIACTVHWLLVVILMMQWIPPLPAALQLMMTVAVYPVVGWVLSQLQRALTPR